ncbi:MAG: hypothetical protein HY335_06095 [Deinococcus sp.]|nr:hypothetical protein [Deinococcus sp.]
MDQEKEGSQRPGSPEEWVANLSSTLRALKERAELLPTLQTELERLRAENQALQERLRQPDHSGELERLRSENQELKQQVTELESTSPSLPAEVVPPLPAPSSEESRILHAALTSSLGMIWEELGRLKQRLEHTEENLAALPAGSSGPELRPLPGIAQAAQVMQRLTSAAKTEAPPAEPAPPSSLEEVPPEVVAAGRAAARAAFVPEPPPPAEARPQPPQAETTATFVPPYGRPIEVRRETQLPYTHTEARAASEPAFPVPAEAKLVPAPAPQLAKPTTWQRVWKWLKEN